MYLKKIFCAALALSSAAALSGRPAQTAPFRFTQPDGSVIELRQVGDEHFHFVTEVSTGLPVLCVGDTYYYAQPAAKGGVEASAFRVGGEVTGEFASAVAPRAVEIMKEAMTSKAAGTRAAASASFGRFTYIGSEPVNFVLKGDVPCLVILAQFSDVKFKTSMTDIERWLNDEGTGAAYPSGSVRSYFLHQSNGRFRPTFEVYGTYTATRSASYYNGREGELVVNALNYLSSQIDLSRYDVNGDGAVDNVYLIYAGEGGHLYGYEDRIWPANTIVSATVRGLRVNRIAYANEIAYGAQQGIGTFCHEFGHVLGLADLYTLGGNWPSSTADYWTPTFWDVMDVGCDLNDGYTPPNYSTFERHALGWTEPYELTRSETVFLNGVEGGGRGAMVRNSADPGEVVYMEYRDRTGWDSYHSGSGLLVWHVRYDEDEWNYGSVNNSSTSPRVKVVAADGKSGNNSISDYYGTLNYGRDPYLGGDPFPGTTGKTSFGASTSPAFKTAAGKTFALADGKTSPDLTGIGLRDVDGKTYMAFDVAGAADGFTIVSPDGEYSAITAVGADAAAPRIYGSGRTVSVDNAAAAGVEVFDLTGRRVAFAQAQAGGCVSLTVAAPGIYLVRSGSAVAKVSLR